METNTSGRRICKRCSGTGNSGHHQDGGHCYGCDGTGYHPSAEEEAKAAAKTKVREIAARKAEVAHARENVEKAQAGWSKRNAEKNLARSLEVLAFWEGR